MRPTERREHHVRFTMMVVMTGSAHAFAREEYVRAFLDGLRISYTSPAMGSVAHHLDELAFHLHTSVVASLRAVKAYYKGDPCAHVSTYMWTARHFHDSYGSVVVRYIDQDRFEAVERSLGVWRCVGRHNYLSISSSLENRLGYFGVAAGYIAGSTADSRANPKACERSTAALADIFTQLFKLSLTLLSDVVDVPKFPDVPPAVGAAAIEAYLNDFPEEDVMELDNRVYGSEPIYVDEAEGYDNFCREARLAVYQLCTEMDRLFFGRTDTTKNWLKNAAVFRLYFLLLGAAR
ncbi:hypothetical protein I4F81_007379 [Pyropia yezoensis]|uniref:Uncharacterized protein n=1 Tax=Pyropia yezoensis TaxID=2788 RepID=A0ACC3C3U9_PYRYE|nr:hypothetical protein I4F81_007379 [Neopyropia yezoensis]